MTSHLFFNLKQLKSLGRKDFDEVIFDEMIFDVMSNPQRQHQHEQHIKTFQLTEKSFLTTMTKHISNFFLSFQEKPFFEKFHPAFINLSNWPRKCFLMKECVHFRLSLFQESLTFLKKRKQKKTRQKQEQKQKNRFKYFYSFHCFVAAKPQILTTTVITKLNNSNIIDNH